MAKEKTGGDQPPSGMMMMLRIMGIEFDPDIFKQVGAAVMDVRDRLKRIEEKQDKILAWQESCNDGRNSESSSTSGSGERNGQGAGSGSENRV